MSPCRNTLKSLTVFLVIGFTYVGLWHHYNDRHLKSWDGYRIPDLIVYQDAKNKLIAHQNIYTFREFGNAFTYSPTAAYLFRHLFPQSDFRTIVIQWEHVSLCVLFLTFVWIFLIFRYCGISPPFILFPIALLLIFRYVDRDLNNGQMNLLILNAFLLGCLFYLKKWKLSTGFCFAFILLFKPFLVLFFVLYWLLQKDWKVLFGTSIFYSAFLALPSIELGWGETRQNLSSYRDFLLLRAHQDSYLLDSTKNQSLVPLLHTLFSSQTLSMVFTELLGTLSFLYIYHHFLKKVGEKEKHLFFWVISLCLTLIFSAAIWKEYFMFLALPYAYWMSLSMGSIVPWMKTWRGLVTLLFLGLSVIKFPFVQILVTATLLTFILTDL